MPETMHDEEPRSKRARKLSLKGQSKGDKSSSKKSSKKRTSSTKTNAQPSDSSNPTASTTILKSSDPMQLDGEATTLSIEWKTTTSGKPKPQATISGNRKLDTHVDESTKKNKRKRSTKKKDLSWTPGCESTKQSTGSLSHIFGDKTTEVNGKPIETFVAFKTNAFNLKVDLPPGIDESKIFSAIGTEFGKNINKVNKKGEKLIPFHQSYQHTLETSATGSPIVIQSKNGTRLTRKVNTNLLSIYTSQDDSFAPPRITSLSPDDPFFLSAEHAIVGVNPYQKIQQKIKITRALLAEARKKIKDLPKREQNGLMGASATDYFQSAGIHPPQQDDSSKARKGHWCHGIAYAVLHMHSHIKDYIGCGTDSDNGLCTVLESLLQQLANDYPEGFDLTVTFEFVPNTRLLTDIKYDLETAHDIKHIAFNAQNWNRPHVSTWPYAKALFDATHTILDGLQKTGKLPEADPLKDGDAIMYYPAPKPKEVAIKHDENPFAINSSSMLVTPSVLPAMQGLPITEHLTTPMSIMQADEYTAAPAAAAEDTASPQTVAAHRDLFLGLIPPSASDPYKTESAPPSSSTFSCLDKPSQALTSPDPALSMPLDYEYDPPLGSLQESSSSLSASQELAPFTGLAIASPQMPALSLTGNPSGFFKRPSDPKVGDTVASLSLSSPFDL